MTSTVTVYRPQRKIWLLYGFITLLLLLNSLYWFFDPVPIWVSFLGGLILAYWAFVLVGVARARVELRERTLEIYGPAYPILPSNRGNWLYGFLLLFLIWDAAALLFGPFPRWVAQARFAVNLLWLAGYLLFLVSQLPRGRQSIAYLDIDGPPWEDAWGPSRLLAARRKGLFIRLVDRPLAVMLPPWLSEADRYDLAGRLNAHVKHAHALQAAPPDPALAREA